MRAASAGRHSVGRDEEVEAVVVPADDGKLVWPDGREAGVGADGVTVLGMDGRALVDPEGGCLVLGADGGVSTMGGYPFRVLLHRGGRSQVIMQTETGRYVDRHGAWYTTNGDRILTALDGKPLAARDGRHVISLGSQLQLEDNTLVARGPDGAPATWIDGSAVTVAPDNHTVLGPDGKTLYIEGRPVEIDDEGYLTEAVGSYVIGASREPTGGNEVHTRSVQLKEALNNTNMELRAVKDALEQAQAELIAEKVKAKTTVVVEDTVSTRELLVLREQLDSERVARGVVEGKVQQIEAEARQQKWAADDHVAELQRELRDASHEDTAALQRLKLAVEAQSRRVSAREEELSHMRGRLEAEEERVKALEGGMGAERLTLQAEYSKLADQHKAVNADYNTLRARAHDLEESHIRTTDKQQTELMSLRSQFEESKRAVRSLEEQLTAASRSAMQSHTKSEEVLHLQHLLDMEVARRERAEKSFEDLKRQHDAHSEEAFAQLTNITIDRDRYMRQLREKERECDEFQWEEGTSKKEIKRLKDDVQRVNDSVQAVKDARDRLSVELEKEKEARKADHDLYTSRLTEAVEEKESTLKIIPAAVKEAERAKAVAEERNAALQRHIKEQSEELERYRSEVGEAHEEVLNVKRVYQEKEEQSAKEITRLKSLEEEYRRDRRTLESQIETTQTGTRDRDEVVMGLRRELEKMARKKEKAEKRYNTTYRHHTRRMALEAYSLRNENTVNEEMTAELMAVRREKDEALALIEVQETKWRRILETVDSRDAVVDNLRMQVTTLQMEKEVELREREEAAQARLTVLKCAQGSALNQMLSPPPVTPPMYELPSEPGPPTATPTEVWHSMPYQQAGQAMLTTPLSPAPTPCEVATLPLCSPAPTSVRKSIRWTSPIREAPQINPSEYLPPVTGLLVEKGLSDSHHTFKYNLARNYPPISPSPLRY